MQNRELFTVRQCTFVAGIVLALGQVSVAANANGVEKHSMTSAPPAVHAHRSRATCEIHIQRLVADAMVYLIDNDGRFPDNPRTFAQDIADNGVAAGTSADPSRDLSMIAKPDRPRSGLYAHHGAGVDGVDIFTYNSRLAGTSRIDIHDPAHTVLVYEGANERLMFAHGGKAIVAFVDGHVDEVSARDDATLRWKP